MHVALSSLCVYVLTEVAVDLDLHTAVCLIPQLELDAAAARSDGLAYLGGLSELSSNHKEPIVTLQYRTSSRQATSGYKLSIACRHWAAESGLYRVQQHASAGANLCGLRELFLRCLSVHDCAKHCVGQLNDFLCCRGS